MGGDVEEKSKADQGVWEDEEAEEREAAGAGDGAAHVAWRRREGEG
jgi:hypothetical protein